MNEVISTKIHDLLKNVVTGNMEDYSISVGESNKKGEGFLGEMCYISLKENTTGEKLDVIVKQAFSDSKMRGYIPIRTLYQNEIHFYNKVWPCFQRLQADRSISKPFNKIPKCFITTLEDGGEKLILENLKYQNFQLYDKKRPFDDEHIKFILKEYGKFHAISFAYKLLKQEEYHEITKNLDDIFANMDKLIMGEHIKRSCQTSLQSLDAQKDSKVIDKLKPYLENLLEIFCRKNNYNGDNAVLLHGDCWSNNMMFKYNASKELCDMKLLDFQCSKVGTPVFDLSYCLYAGASKEILDDLDYYLRVYHDSLLESLDNFGLTSENLYPFEELKKEWTQYCQVGFTMGLALWRMKLTYDDNVKDLSDMQDKNPTSNLDEMKYDVQTYNQRVRDLILHMFHNGYL